MEKLELAIDGIDIDADIAEFIAMHTVEEGQDSGSGESGFDGPLVQSGQALTYMDLTMFQDKSNDRDSGGISIPNVAEKEEGKEVVPSSGNRPTGNALDDTYLEVEAQLRELLQL